MSGCNSPPMTVPPEPTGPTTSPDGVDLTLIRWMLSLTPRERLRVLCDQVAAIERLKAKLTDGD